MDLNTLLTEDLQQWLLDREPWTLYRTLTWLLGRGEDDDSVVSARTEIPNHPLIKEIFGELNDDGQTLLLVCNDAFGDRSISS